MDFACDDDNARIILTADPYTREYLMDTPVSVKCALTGACEEVEAATPQPPDFGEVMFPVLDYSLL